MHSRAAKPALVLLSLFCLAGCVSKRPDRLTVLFFNDSHGYLEPFTVEQDGKKAEVGGMARLAAEVKRIRKNNKSLGIPTVLLCAGDILQGTPMSTVFRGKADIDCMNAMGVDAMCVGNHEFDFGLENFHELRKRAKFPFLSANIDIERPNGSAQLRLPQRMPLCPATARLDLGGGTALTVVGVTTKELLVTTAPWNVNRLAVRDPVESVGAVMMRPETGRPALILSHCLRTTDRELAARTFGVSALIGGHDHLLMSPERGKFPILQAFEKMRYLGRADFDIDLANGRARLRDHSYIPIVAGMPEDVKAKRIIASYAGRMDKRFKQVIGWTDQYLGADRGSIRYRETNLGNFVADSVREHTGAQVALVNGGGIRASIRPGEITVEDVFKTMPFANEVIILELTGKQLLALLQRSAKSTRADEYGGFFQVSGLQFVIADRKARSVCIGPDKQPLDAATTYTVAVPDFIAAGGDGYSMLKELPRRKTGSILRDLLVDTIRRRKKIEAQVEGRIRRK